MSVLEILLTFVAKHFCNRIVIKDRKTDTPYLIRYILVSTRFFSVYIHRFLISDKGDHHDHPWNFFTWVITKGYKEERLDQNLNNPRGTYVEGSVRRDPGTIAYRKAGTLHRVVLDRHYTPEEESIAPLTVCLIGKRQRVWGFAKATEKGLNWTNWIDYLELSEEEAEEEIRRKAGV